MNLIFKPSLSHPYLTELGYFQECLTIRTQVEVISENLGCRNSSHLFPATASLIHVMLISSRANTKSEHTSIVVPSAHPQGSWLLEQTILSVHSEWLVPCQVTHSPSVICKGQQHRQQMELLHGHHIMGTCEMSLARITKHRWVCRHSSRQRQAGDKGRWGNYYLNIDLLSGGRNS